MMKTEVYLSSFVYRIIEFIAIFLLLPLLFYTDILPVPKIIGLLSGTLVCLIILRYDPGWSIHQLKKWPAGNLPYRILGYRTGFTMLFIGMLVFYVDKSSFLIFPREQPGVWGIVMVLYPVLSALPQEFIYRVFLFNRYRVLFPSQKLRILVSTLSFSYLHIIYDNFWAVGLSLIGGLLLSLTYNRTRSLLWTSIEHAVYGWIVFTLGMGSYFYEPF